jgi:hypothetical protein
MGRIWPNMPSGSVTKVSVGQYTEVQRGWLNTKGLSDVNAKRYLLIYLEANFTSIVKSKR